MKQTVYIIDINGIHWLPSLKSRNENWGRSLWFERVTGFEGHLADEDSWCRLTEKYPIKTCRDEEVSSPPDI